MEKDYLNKGLSSKEVLELQKKYGKNELKDKNKELFIIKIFHIICEPMFLLLIVAATIYFILGEPRDGIIMLVFVIGVISIDIIQEYKTDKTLNALKELSSPKITVIRDNDKKVINSKDLVPGDLMLIHEGVKIPADGHIVKCDGISIDESSLTGESEVVNKTISNFKKDHNEYYRNDYCYAGTLVIRGNATVLVDKIGNETEYGKIGTFVSDIKNDTTPLQKQTRKLVRTCAYIALILFIIVSLITFMNISDHPIKERVIESILSGITLAMAMIPEEFPVVLTVFLSAGAWRLAKKNSLVKKLSSVEALGAVSVLCVDKTGTITMNEMTVSDIYSENIDDTSEIMGLCCDEDTYDPMEKAMLRFCKERQISKNHLFAGQIIKKYPFDNNNNMMGVLWYHDKTNVLAVKGSPENVLKLCNIKNDTEIKSKINDMSLKGYRVIAIAKSIFTSEFKIENNIENYKLELCGLVGLLDPPRLEIEKDIILCYKSGIKVVMITGDNGITAASIASKIGIKNSNNIITGAELNKMNEEELKLAVKKVSIFSRVTPEDKMKIVAAFKNNGETVAMIGDGVNDAPALKKADIGIAMGKKGSDVSRAAADLILMDDNFSTVIDTIKDGRRIYDNIKKAVEYIFTIHIPIALSSLVAPLLNVGPASLLLLPLHVVLLELVIDPTCSVVLERLPEEKNIMQRMPRNPNESIVTFNSLLKSIIQGIVLFVFSFGSYYYILNSVGDAYLARTYGLLILIIGNLLLVQVNSSKTEYAYTSIKLLIKDKVMWISNIITVIGIILMVYTPLNSYLKLTSLSLKEFAIVILLSFISVFWYEIVKAYKKITK